MTIEDEMKREIKRLESELKLINKEIQKLEGKIVNLINIKKKSEHNLQVLKENVSTSEEVYIEQTLQELIKR